MKSRAEPSFWKQYRQVPIDVRLRARKAYRLWQLNPAHPGLAFKRLNMPMPLFSVRITQSYRAVARLKDDAFIWFFIGNHDDYMRLIASVS